MQSGNPAHKRMETAGGLNSARKARGKVTALAALVGPLLVTSHRRREALHRQVNFPFPKALQTFKICADVGACMNYETQTGLLPGGFGGVDTLFIS